MEMVDKIIFNKLLARESIFLPSIGALVPKQTPAKLVDKNKLTPPQWRVIFSKNNDNVVSIIDVISQKTGVNSFQALDIYNQWFKSANKEGKYIINGVGDINKDFFTLDKSLAVLINPLEGKNIIISKTKAKSQLSIGVIALIAVTISVGIGYIFLGDVIQKKEQVPEIKTIVWQASEDNNDETDTIKSINIDNKISSEQSRDTTNNSTIKIENKNSEKKSLTTTYYLAVGIYSTTNNANEFISKLKKESDSLTLTKIKFKNDKILVSAYSSQNYDIIEKHKKRLIKRFPEIWVYREVK